MAVDEAQIFAPRERLPIFDECTYDVEFDEHQAFETELEHLSFLISEWCDNSDSIIEQAVLIANELDAIQVKCNISDTVGSSVGIIGGVVTMASLVLMPPLALAGAVVGGLGAATNVVTSIVSWSAIRKRVDRLKPLLCRDQLLLNQIQKYLQCTHEFFHESLSNELKVKVPAAAFVCSAAGIGARTLLKKSTKLTPQLVKTFAHSAAGLGIVLDSISLISTAKKLSKGSKNEFAAELRTFALQIAAEKRSFEDPNILHKFNTPDLLEEY